MKKAVIAGPHDGRVVETTQPTPKENWVLIKVHVAPLCTEYKGFQAGRESQFIGHEAAGEVIEVAQPGKVKVGDRVVVMPQYPCGKCALCLSGEYIHCQNNIDFEAFTGSAEGRATVAQYLLKPDWLLVPIPDGVSYEHASMACCGLGPTFGAFQRMALEAGETVLITGLGPVGLGGVVNGSHRHAKVIGVDGNRWRAKRAIQLGAQVVLDPAANDMRDQILELTSGLGVDKAIDCSGVVAAHRLCIDATRRQGEIAFVGECGEATPLFISDDMIRKGLTLHGAWHYNLADSPKMMKLIADIPEKLDLLISHRYPLDGIQQAWESQVAGNCAKVVIKPWEETT